MKVSVLKPELTIFDRACRLGRSNLARTLVASLLLVQPHSASAALSFARGTPTTVGSVRFANTPDSVTITAAFTGPGTITSGLAIPANRIQYDIINSDQGPMLSWTVFYPAVVGPDIIGAHTPVGYLDFLGTIVPEGGYAYTTLFNAGYGVYSYNVGAPWTIDYEPDHIKFSTAAVPPSGLPANDGEGFLDPTHYLPSFAILFNPNLANGLVPATAVISGATLSGQVYGPLPGNPCLSIQCTNLTVETCSPCAPVTFSATATDTCCTNPPVVQYFPPSGTCFPTNTVNHITVVASDSCGNSVSNFFTVTVLPGANCQPTNCISIFATNIIAHTCSNCTSVAYDVFVTDACCPIAPPTVVFNPPPGTCFPVNSTTPVHVLAYDPCGHTNTATFDVTVLPGPDCGNTNCIQIYATNITWLTCSNCSTVPYNAFAVDTCCPGQPNPPLTFNPPETTCFPANSTTTVMATAVDQCGNTATKFFTVTVLHDPGCNTNCLQLYATNVVAFTCSNCTTVAFNAYATDPCCPAPPTLMFNPPETTCFPVNVTTPVLVTAVDQCGHTNSKTFTVTVLPGAGCNTNCISIYATNVTAFTCSNCTAVTYNVSATDTCCPAGLGLTFSPPETTCFPVNTTTPVLVTAIDQCGHTNTATFTVTVLPGAGCNTNCISIFATNITAFTCTNCAFVTYNAFATDTCCAASPTLTFNPPETTCFPVNTTTPVLVTAIDQCGHTNTATFTVTVLPGAGCNTNCISIFATNITAFTCTNCAFVTYNAFATDTCCAASPTLTFNPPETTCFPVNVTTPVLVTAIDQCGHTNNAIFTVTVLPGLNCPPTNCISLYASNVVVYTCSNCVPVPYNVIAIDQCCTNNVTLTYNPPVNTCFPRNTVTPVHVIAHDTCGHTAVGVFTVTVLPAAGCGGTNPGINMTGPSTLGDPVTNYYALWWNVTNNVQLEATPDLFNWQPVPGGTNSPYVVPATSPMNFFRLHYQ